MTLRSQIACTRSLCCLAALAHLAGCSSGGGPGFAALDAGGTAARGGQAGSAGASGGSAGAAGNVEVPAAGASAAGFGGVGEVSGVGGGAGSGGDEPPPEKPKTPEVVDERPFFSFFVTSQAGLYGLSAGQAFPTPDAINGFGGNFGGLAGADEICTTLARAASPTDRKVWRAFLSTSGLGGGERVDAVERIGPGPWFDYNGRKLADDAAGLLPEGNDGRPRDADPQLADMFTDENGEDARPNQQTDNHDILTGSGPDGRLFDDGEDGQIATCEDWSSNTVRGEEGNAFGVGGQVPVGHSWPRSNMNGRHWINDHTINGCEAGFDVDGGAGAPAGDFRVGAGGGYGGIYCFALGAVAPE